jgi:nucleoside-diphosphate-sugar epimerase
MVFENEKVLVTGGSGYIGSVLTEKLLQRGAHVVVLDNFTYTDMGIRHLLRCENLYVIKGDIRDREAVISAVSGVDYVIHLAAIANDPSGELNPELTKSVNLRAYDLLLEYAKKAGVRRFINASTFSVYGIKSEANVTEDLPLNPQKEYSVCKAKSEVVVREYNSSDFVTTSLRCATVCGWSGRQRFDLIVNMLTYHALLYRKITVLGGEQQRPQIHIQDITDYFIALLHANPQLIGGEVFNAGGQNTSISEIAYTICDVLGDDIDLEFLPPRDDERSYHVSSEKIFRMLGLYPTHSIRDAIKDIAMSYQQGLFADPLDPLYHNVKRMKALEQQG